MVQSNADSTEAGAKISQAALTLASVDILRTHRSAEHHAAMGVQREGIFGPVVCAIPFDSAKKSRRLLIKPLWFGRQHLDATFQSVAFGEELKAGAVWVNLMFSTFPGVFNQVGVRARREGVGSVRWIEGVTLL
jgi:acyl-CoA reductase-like NAD-dependent aldehyde dehydrogenase